ncbi:MAG: ATP synthase F1 subunit delta [Candidatus Sericytochromatia bacterium]|nr:ATP synthase F1 subunit delta [Candidatus Sericytochromatia bacterium]
MIADRYADALFQAAEAHGEELLSRVDEELTALAEALRTSPDLARAFQAPTIKVAEKQAVARQLMAAAHPLTRNALLLMLEKKRGALLPELRGAFRRRLDARQRRAAVQVTSAFALDEQQTLSLSAQLERQLGQSVVMQTLVDPSLIGGCIVKIDDQVIDYSLRGRLEALRLSLN